MRFKGWGVRLAVLAAMLPTAGRVVLAQDAQGDEEKHGRKYKAPVVTSHLEVTVLRDTGKPIANAAVIVRPTKDGEDVGNMELKTGPDGKASIDVIPTGSDVALQVIADGYATHGGHLLLNEATKAITVKMQKPKSQISAYGEDASGTARGVGVRESTGRTVTPTARTIAAHEPIVKLPGVSAQGGSSISGRLTTEGEVPVSDATVEVLDAGTKKVIRTVKTTDDGRYAVVNLQGGAYSLKMSAGGYSSVDSAVTLAEKQNKIVDQVLESARKKKAKK